MAKVSSTQNNGSSATPTVSVPASAAANQIAIAILTTDQFIDVSTLFPSGFTFGEQVSFQDSELAWGWKRLSGADSGTYTWGNLGASHSYATVCALFDGRDTGNPPVGATGATGLTPTLSPLSPASNAVTALTGDDLVFAQTFDWAVNWAAVTWGNPAGFSALENFDGSTGAVFHPMGSSYKENVSSGSTSATGSATWTDGGTLTARWGAYLIRIPAGASAAGNIAWIKA